MLYPQLAKQADVTSLTQFLDDPNWVMEQKCDGHRLLLCSPGANMPPTALTRNGSVYTRTLPREIRDFRFPKGEWVLDGELVGTVVNGHTVSSAFHVFDLPVSPLTSAVTLEQRRAVLETLLGSIRHPFKLLPQARTRDEKLRLADIALKQYFEGLIVKRRNSLYASGGRNNDWLKIKFVTTADVVVKDVRTNGKDAVSYEVYDEHGKAVAIGRASLIGKEKAGAINVGDVLEVRYLYVGSDGRLYQPTIIRKRDDKLPHECTTDQLKFVNKSVLETL